MRRIIALLVVGLLAGCGPATITRAGASARACDQYRAMAEQAPRLSKSDFRRDIRRIDRLADAGASAAVRHRADALTLDVFAGDWSSAETLHEVRALGRACTAIGR
ncbi:MAG TPA: hypothetical protein VN088_16245 [Nocardioides sp.]|nr:hypothetical protein [Nocardioides sp.]